LLCSFGWFSHLIGCTPQWWVPGLRIQHRSTGFPQWFFGASSRLLEVRPVIPCIEVRVYIERDADASVSTLTGSACSGKEGVEAVYSGSTAAVRAAM